MIQNHTISSHHHGHSSENGVHKSKAHSPSPSEISNPYKQIDIYCYNPATPLGKGAFGQVFKAFDVTKNYSELAVKVIPASRLLEDEESFALFLREIEVLTQIKSENVVQLFDVKRTPNNLYIFMEYCNGGDLERVIRTAAPLAEKDCLIILKQIVNAFVTISKLDIRNSKGNKVIIMHRDIKPANILLHNGKIKIADFGFAKFVDDNLKNIKARHTILGTPYFMPPQILANSPYSPKCDVWSTGILLYQCLFKKLPWCTPGLKEMYKTITTKPLEFPKEIPISKDTQDLISGMLKIKEEDRLDWQSIADHRALKGISLP